MKWSAFFIIACSAYLLGSLNAAIVVSRLTLHKDIRSFGSGNAGLTNSLRVMGGKRTVLVLIGDVLKAVIAVSLGGMLMGPMGKLVAGVFVILGHVFPVYFGFRGGKGVLVGAVMLAIFDIRIFGIAFGLFLLAVVLTRWVSLGSILGAIAFPICTHLFYHSIPLTLMSLLMGGAVVFMHRSNVGRIIKGTENRFSIHSKPQITAENTTVPRSEK